MEQEIVKGFVLNRKEPLGSGGFGSVFVAYQVDTKTQVACQQIQRSDDQMKQILYQQYQQTEVTNVKGFNHPNIVKLIDFVETPNQMFLFFEFCDQGDLRWYLHKRKMAKNYPSFDTLQTYMFHMLLTIEYLHKNQLIHRDLKPDNFLLTSAPQSLDGKIEDPILKLGDFGLSQQLNFDKNAPAFTQIGTACYSAPEILNGKKYYDGKIDVWALGLIFYEIIYGEILFSSNYIEEIKQQIEDCCQGGDFTQFPNSSRFFQESEIGQLKNLISKMVCYDEYQRFDATQSLLHPFFSNLAQLYQDSDLTDTFREDQEALYNSFQVHRESAYKMKPNFAQNEQQSTQSSTEEQNIKPKYPNLDELDSPKQNSTEEAQKGSLEKEPLIKNVQISPQPKQKSIQSMSNMQKYEYLVDLAYNKVYFFSSFVNTFYYSHEQKSIPEFMQYMIMMLFNEGTINSIELLQQYVVVGPVGSSSQDLTLKLDFETFKKTKKYTDMLANSTQVVSTQSSYESSIQNLANQLNRIQQTETTQDDDTFKDIENFLLHQQNNLFRQDKTIVVFSRSIVKKLRTIIKISSIPSRNLAQLLVGILSLVECIQNQYPVNHNILQYEMQKPSLQQLKDQIEKFE